MKTCQECQPNGRTATHSGIDAATKDLMIAGGNSKKVIILLTDGEPYVSVDYFKTTCGYAPSCVAYKCEYVFSSATNKLITYTKDPTCAIKKADEAKQKGIDIYTVGVGQVTSNAEFEALLQNKLASVPDWYKPVTESSILGAFAEELVGTIACDPTREPLVNIDGCNCVCRLNYVDPGDANASCSMQTPTPLPFPKSAPTPVPYT